MLSGFIICAFGHQIKKKRLVPTDSHVPKDSAKMQICIFAKVNPLMMEEGILFLKPLP